MPTHPPWNAEVAVTCELARSLIEGQFPQFAGTPIRLFANGWDNTAFLVTERFVFRFPRRQLAVQLLATETQVLPTIADKLPIRVPVPIFSGEPAQGYPWPFAGYEIIPGREACECDLDDAQRIAIARPLAEFLAALHGIPVGQAVPPDALGRLEMPRRVTRAKAMLAMFAERLVIGPDVAPRLGELLDAAPPPYEPRSDTLVHGDLYCRHLLLSPENRLVGVIDWGDVHRGDAAADLMAAHLLLPPSAHASFRAAYGAIDDLTWQVARLRATWHALYVLEYAAAIAHPAILRETLGTLHRIVDRC